MSADKIQLRDVTLKDLTHIEDVAPQKVTFKLEKTKEEVTVAEIYRRAYRSSRVGSEEEALSLRIEANTVLLEEVEKLARHLVEILLDVKDGNADLFRSSLANVIDYQKKLQKILIRDIELQNSKSVKVSGYLNFRDFTDEELELFWNNK